MRNLEGFSCQPEGELEGFSLFQLILKETWRIENFDVFFDFKVARTLRHNITWISFLSYQIYSMFQFDHVFNKESGSNEFNAEA